MLFSLLRRLRGGSARPDVGPSYAEGNRLYRLGQYEEALRHYDRALALNRAHTNAAFNRANALSALGRFAEAVASYDQALAVEPVADAWNNRGIALQAMQRPEEALASFERALALHPTYVDALNNRAIVLRLLSRVWEAIGAYEELLVIAPDYTYARGSVAQLRAAIYDWGSWTKLAQQIRSDVKAGRLSTAPFEFLLFADEPELQLACARMHARENSLDVPAMMFAAVRRNHDKLRIAYLSADFGDHAIGHLTAGLFSRHDRGAFDITGVSIGPPRDDEVRNRLMKGFDRFIDAYALSDDRVAAMLRDLEIDIAVDMMGYTRHARPAILSTRPAPVQVNYLGYPGTMGVSFIDYVLTDEFIVPEEQRIHFSESVAYLPHCYQANDSARRIDERQPTRQEAGLPQEGFVFCCFNNSAKVTPQMFDIWMRLLRRVDGSVLWLLHEDAEAEENLRREARARGVEPSRLVFAGRAPAAEHLARHRLADIFLDTLPYNAHTTASDALWAGLLLLTCPGVGFASRVAGSLLKTLGLPELITRDLVEYEALAFTLATDRLRLATLKQRLATNIGSSPMFDTDRFCKYLESAYRTMWEIHARGDMPRSFKVPA